MKSSGLKKANSFYRKRKYSRTISHLEPQVFLFRDNPEYYQLLGRSCFFTGDYGGSYSYIKRALDLDEHDIESRLFLAAVHLRRRESDKSILEWLSVLDRDPKNKFAKRGLNFIRNLNTSEQLQEKIEGKELLKLVPRKIQLPWIPVLISVIILLSVMLAAYIIPRIDIDLSRFNPSRPPRPGVEIIQFPQGQALTSLEGEYVYILSENEIQNILDRIAHFFNTEQDNMVRREINRILLSTATSPVKERVQILRQSLSVPDFLTMDTSFSYRTVHQELMLHNGVYVRWKGRPTNIIRAEDGVQFTLLVGYHTGETLEGSVPVIVPFATHVRSDMGIELIGRIQAIQSDDHPSGSPFIIEASSVRIFEL